MAETDKKINSGFNSLGGFTCFDNNHHFGRNFYYRFLVPALVNLR